MSDLLFPGFEDNDEIFSAVMAYWVGLWDGIAVEERRGWVDWFDGPIRTVHGGNPIFSRCCGGSTPRGLRVIQHEGEASSEDYLAVWTDWFDKGGAGEVRELVIALELTTLTSAFARESIRVWLQ
jgi:hypothetical protein